MEWGGNGGGDRDGEGRSLGVRRLGGPRCVHDGGDTQVPAGGTFLSHGGGGREEALPSCRSLTGAQEGGRRAAEAQSSCRSSDGGSGGR